MPYFSPAQETGAGTKFVGPSSRFPMLAKGGPVKAKRACIVGEKGPEVVVPKTKNVDNSGLTKEKLL